MRKNDTKELWTPRTAGDRAAIHTELEAVIASEHFRSSGRYPAFLQHVVEKTLNGEVADLKERTLGIEVFHRDPDYNTSDDPVVRVCGSEVRRRISQFYQQSENRHEIEIELPPGGYTPQFWRRVPVDEASQEAEQETGTSHLVSHDPRAESRTSERAANEGKGSPPGLKWLLAFGAGVVVSLLGVGVTRQISDQRQEHDPMMQVWGPLLTNPNPVLVSVGRPHPLDEASLTSSSELSIQNRFYQPSYRVSITAVAAISEVAGFLETQKKAFRVHESDSNVLDDLHHRPVVLINGNDNKWTLLFLRPLRFHLESIGDEKQNFSYIKDEQHPERHDWRVDWEQPYLKETVDYAIVGRFYSPTTESPVVVIAGISSNGTEAGGEFMASPEKLNALARDAHSSLDKNFEAVLKVEVVGGNTGAVTPIASHFW